MTSKRVRSGTLPDWANVLADGGEGSLPPALRLQILTTEHWSLLSTRALSWNEAFSRATMFLSVLSGAVVALALVAQATAFGEGFVTFALLILPVVLFVGVTTFMRLVGDQSRGYGLGRRHEPPPPCLPGGRSGTPSVLRQRFDGRRSRDHGHVRGDARTGQFRPRVRDDARHARDRQRRRRRRPRRDPHPAQPDWGRRSGSDRPSRSGSSPSRSS